MVRAVLLALLCVVCAPVYATGSDHSDSCHGNCRQETEGGAPVALIEMSAYGMPIVSTFHCDIPEVVVDGASGFLVPEKDINALAERLEYLMTNPELWGSMGRAGRSHIEKNLNIELQAARLEEHYDSLL